MSFKERMASGWLVWSSAVAAFGLVPSRALAQMVPVPTLVASTATRENGLEQIIDNQTRTYIEKLPEGRDNPAIFRTIQHAVVMPAEIVPNALPRKVFVGFIVGPSGTVRDIKIVRGLTPACDAAALAAVRKRPRFVGEKLNGVPASVSFTVHVLFGHLPKK